MSEQNGKTQNQTETGEETGIKKWRKKIAGGGNEPPRIRLKDIIIVACGIGLIIWGLVLNSGSSSVVATPHPQISVTSLLNASDAGQIANVRITSSTTAAVAEAGAKIEGGSIASEYGGVIEQGTLLSVYVPATVLDSTVAALVANDTPVWLGPSSAAPPTPVGARGVAPTSTYSGAATGSSGGPWGILMILAGTLLTAVGAIRIFSYSRGRKDKIKAAEAEKIEPKGKEAKVPTTRFKDVAGCDEAVEQLKEMVSFLVSDEKYKAIGAKLPKGALLVGPPGTGKTLMARALAGEAGVPFFAVTGSDFVEKYVGVGAKRVRDLFAEARKAKRAIIFIDEVDAVARKRSSDTDNNHHPEAENTLIALLSEMDGFTSSSILVLAATNRADVLDPALTRPGRLDRKVEVPLPDRRGREQILQVHTRGVKIGKGINLTNLAARTPGFSGAQLESVVNEGALEAVRRGLDEVTVACLDDAVATVAMGKARVSAVVTEGDRLITAWHEAGHTLAALMLEDADEPVAVSIVPRGPAGGVTWMSGSDDLFLSRGKAHAQLVVALSGRAAEKILLNGEFTQGASSDLKHATDIALSMTTNYAMTDLGLAFRGSHLGGTSTKEVTETVEELLAGAEKQAEKLLEDNMDLLEAIATALLERNDLEAKDLEEIARNVGAVPASHPTLMPAPPRSVKESPMAGEAYVKVGTKRSGLGQRIKTSIAAAKGAFKESAES